MWQIISSFEIFLTIEIYNTSRLSFSNARTRAETYHYRYVINMLCVSWSFVNNEYRFSARQKHYSIIIINQNSVNFSLLAIPTQNPTCAKGKCTSSFSLKFSVLIQESLGPEIMWLVPEIRVMVDEVSVGIDYSPLRIKISSKC